MEKRQNIVFYSFLSWIVLVLSISYFIFSIDSDKNNDNPPLLNSAIWETLDSSIEVIKKDPIIAPCNWSVEKIVVSWSSMSPLIKSWENLDYFKWYYDCNKVSSWDIVVYKYAIDKKIIKQVKWVEWDEFSFSWWNLYINGKVLKNSLWKEYNLKSKMLDLYSRDYKKIPENSAIILWDNSNWTTDSSQFWFVSTKDFLWKVILD